MYMNTVNKSSSLSPIVRRSIKYIETNYSNNCSLSTLCEILNINKSYLCRLFKKETGLTFTNYVNIFKIEKSKTLLNNKNVSLLDVAISCGFNNQCHYSTTFKKITGYCPMDYRKHLLKTLYNA